MEYITESGRIYALNPSGQLIAEVTFHTHDGTSIIDHTFVDPSLRGQGVAGALVKRAVEKILADGNKVSASCSYARSWLKDNPYPALTESFE